MLIIKCEHYMALLFAACVFCSKKMRDLDDTSGKWVTLTDLSSILHVIFKQVSMSPAQLCYRAQRHPDERHIDISFRRCSLDKFFRLCHQLKKFLPCLCWAFSTHAHSCQHCCLHDVIVNWITETIQLKATSWMGFDAGENVCLCSNCSPAPDLPGNSKCPK